MCWNRYKNVLGLIFGIENFGSNDFYVVKLLVVKDKIMVECLWINRGLDQCFWVDLLQFL